MGKDRFWVHILGYAVFGTALSLGDIMFYEWEFWVALFGVTIVYLNA